MRKSPDQRILSRVGNTIYEWSALFPKPLLRQEDTNAEETRAYIHAYRGIRTDDPNVGTVFSLRQIVHTVCGTRPGSYPVGTGGSFLGGEAIGAWSRPLSSK
jgi:hypothetical protein